MWLVSIRGRGLDYPRNWHELLAWFPDDGACERYLERLRWGSGFSCRFCGAVDSGRWQMSDGLRRCAACRSETSVTAATIFAFAGTRTPLVSWFAAIWYVVDQKQGVSALGLQRVLRLGSYETAWAWLHKLRRAMVLAARELLADAVEVDRREALDQQILRARHALVSGIRRDHPRVGGGHIQVRRPNQQARHPRGDKGDTRRRGHGDQPTAAGPDACAGRGC